MLDERNVNEELAKGVDEFNRRQFFDCHETLEDLWRHYTQDDRECIQGVIQIAVGYYHHLRGNQVGALKLLRRGHERIMKFQPRCLGMDTQTLAAAVSQDIDKLGAHSGEGLPALNVPSIGYSQD
jgi:predicted metal-dependent hydrolase